MADLKEDIKNGSDWTVTAFKSIGKKLDYSIKSVEHIENLLEEQFINGEPIADGLFADGLGGKMFSIASYLGEVIIRNTETTQWEFDTQDPDNAFKMMVSSDDGSRVWPFQKLGKRIQNGNEDNVYHYVIMVIKRFKEEGSEKTSQNSTQTVKVNPSSIEQNSKKPWWKFW